MHDIVLDIQDLHHAFGPKRVLFEVNLKIVRGQIVSLVGPSGCGKSTLLQAILGTHLPSQGIVLMDGEPVVDCDDEDLRTALERAYRKTPVVTDDASYRRLGTHGEVLIHPGDLEWFRAASFVRVPAEAGLEVRLVPRVTEGGFDPAAGYRPFEEAIERLNA